MVKWLRLTETDQHNCFIPNQLTHTKLIYVYFAGAKKTYIFRKMNLKKKKLRADYVCSGIFIHNPILLLDSN